MACLSITQVKTAERPVQMTMRLIVVSSLLYLQHTAASTIWSEGRLNTLWVHVEGSQLSLSPSLTEAASPNTEMTFVTQNIQLDSS